MTIWRILQRTNIVINRSTGPHKDNKIKVNEYFFNKINNEKSAYWLGFLYADGCVTKQQSGSLCLSLCLAQKDVNHLKLFLKDLSSQHHLYYYKPDNKSSVKIIRKQICNDLIKNGCIINKTKIIRLPKLRSNLINHFIIVFFDGDGYVGARRNSLVLTITSTSLKFLESTEAQLRESLDLPYKRIYKVKDSNAYRLSYEGRGLTTKLYNFFI